MIKIVLESPFAGNIKGNIEYARMCVKDSLSRGESPIASHLLYTQKGILNDNIESERNNGINAGLAWLSIADIHVFYIDYGMSSGMKYTLAKSKMLCCKIEFRKIL